LQAGAPLHMGADPMDRAAGRRAGDHGAVGAYLWRSSAGARRTAPRRASGARARPARRRGCAAPRASCGATTSSRSAGETARMRSARQSRRSRGSRSMPMKRRLRRLATAPVVPVPKKGSSTRSPGRVEAMRQRDGRSASGFWVGCALRPSSPLSRSLAAAERHQPVAAHLQLLVERLHALVVEGVARLARGARTRAASRARW